MSAPHTMQQLEQKHEIEERLAALEKAVRKIITFINKIPWSSDDNMD